MDKDIEQCIEDLKGEHPEIAKRIHTAEINRSKRDKLAADALKNNITVWHEENTKRWNAICDLKDLQTVTYVSTTAIVVSSIMYVCSIIGVALIIPLAVLTALVIIFTYGIDERWAEKMKELDK